MKMSKQAELDKIKADIAEQNICAELAKTATQLVFGDGSPDAQIVFIGEAPGKNEDEQGLPFVGAAGKFLNEMLSGIGLTRKDVYITNIDRQIIVIHTQTKKWPFYLFCAPS